MRTTAAFLASILLLFCCTSTFAQLATTERPSPAVKHVLVVSIDGLRPDVALRADMPTLRTLVKRGSFSFWARTTEVSITLPSHTSMLTGVTPAKHNISWNDDRATWEVLKVPTLLERAHAAGYTTAMVASKAKFKLFDKPGAVDHAYWPKTDSVRDDDTSAAAAVDIVTKYKPDVMFLHFGSVDSVGHGIGWGTPQQIAAIEAVDKLLGSVVTAYTDAGLIDSTVIILSADHGGAGRTHGRDDFRSRHIPWIAAGPNVLPGQDLTNFRELVINTEDTFATACWLMGIDPGTDIDGKPITQIFKQKPVEMLQPAAATQMAPAATQPTTTTAK